MPSIPYSLVPGSAGEKDERRLSSGGLSTSSSSSLLERLFVVIGIPLLLTSFSLQAALTSQADILKLPISHEALGGKTAAERSRVGGFYRGQHGPATMQTQGERLDSIRATLRAAVVALTAAGVDEIFIDGDTLVGHLRESPGDLRAWARSATLGFSQKQCRKSSSLALSKKKLEKLISDDFRVLWFACSSGGRAAGRIVDKKTGFYVDVIAHAERRKTGPGFSCEGVSAFPLAVTKVEFAGISVSLPGNPEALIACKHGNSEYPALWPLNFSVYTWISWLSVVAVLGVVAVLSEGSGLEMAAPVISAFGKTGLQLLAFMYILARQTASLDRKMTLKSVCRTVPLLLLAWTLIALDSHVLIAQAIAWGWEREGFLGDFI